MYLSTCTQGVSAISPGHVTLLLLLTDVLAMHVNAFKSLCCAVLVLHVPSIFMEVTIFIDGTLMHEEGLIDEEADGHEDVWHRQDQHSRVTSMKS